MRVISDWSLREPASDRPTLVCEVLLESTSELLILSVWRTAAPSADSPKGRFRGLVEWRGNLNTQEHPDFGSWEAAVAWCTRTAEALDALR